MAKEIGCHLPGSDHLSAVESVHCPSYSAYLATSSAVCSSMTFAMKYKVRSMPADTPLELTITDYLQVSTVPSCAKLKPNIMKCFKQFRYKVQSQVYACWHSTCCQHIGILSQEEQKISCCAASRQKPLLGRDSLGVHAMSTDGPWKPSKTQNTNV